MFVLKALAIVLALLLLIGGCVGLMHILWRGKKRK